MGNDMGKKGTKYTLRADGRIMRTETINGKRKSFYGHSDEEVNAKYNAFIAQLNATRTLKNIAEDWWEAKQATISPNTFNGFKTAKNRVVEDFGEKEAKDITVAQIYAFLDKFRAQGMSQKVISNTRCVFKLIMDKALTEGEITFNPVVMTPTVKGVARKPRQPAPDPELAIIEKHKADSMSARFYYFVLYTGLRRGEALCLLNRDIDRENAIVTVSKSVAFKNSAPVIKEPKTSAGIREVHIPPNVLEILPEGKPDELIWFGGTKIPSKTPVERFLRSFREQTGVTSTPHQLRHNYASMLHSAQVDVKDAQVLLGHANIAVTQDIYTHLEKKRRDSVSQQIDAEVLSRLLSKEPQAVENG